MPAKVAFLLRPPVLSCAHTCHGVGRHWSVCGLLDVRQGGKWRCGRVRRNDSAPDHDVVLDAFLRPHSEHGSCIASRGLEVDPCNRAKLPAVLRAPVSYRRGEVSPDAAGSIKLAPEAGYSACSKVIFCGAGWNKCATLPVK